MPSRLLTSESVTEGHPDKLADQISDAVLDTVLRDDPQAHAAIEVFISTGLIIVGGELNCETYADIASIARDVCRDVGYTRAKYGFDADTCGVIVCVKEQSPEIAEGVAHSWEARHLSVDSDPLDTKGAGDQGIVFGYATNETPELMPLPIQAAHKLARRLAEVRKAGLLPYLRPDGKTQVTVRYENDIPQEIDQILISAQHNPGINSEELMRVDLWEHVIEPVLSMSYSGLYDTKSLRKKILVNPSGPFSMGGPYADTGLTGRKIIVDTYGGAARHGGGAFSGKDPSKVDRSAAYAARHVAKNIVAAGLATRCEVQVAYAIGVAHPVSVSVECFGTEKAPLKHIETLIRENFDLRPAAIIQDLNLLRPIYQKTATYGHFGREESNFTWERLNKVNSLRDR